jgi:alpha-L-fucosidase
MPMARSWSFVPNDTYKSSRVLIQMLVDVVAKGGNLLLNIGPGPDGAWHDAAYDRLAALGAWMKDNSAAIYGTRPMAPYSAGQVRFTRAKDGVVFAIYLPGATETAIPRRVAIAGVAPAAGATVTLLGAGGAGRAIPWERSADGCVLLAALRSRATQRGRVGLPDVECRALAARPAISGSRRSRPTARGSRSPRRRRVDPHWRKDGKEIVYAAPSGQLSR